jgi:hypothetical protein
MGKLRLSETL